MCAAPASRHRVKGLLSVKGCDRLGFISCFRIGRGSSRGRDILSSHNTRITVMDQRSLPQNEFTPPGQAPRHALSFVPPERRKAPSLMRSASGGQGVSSLALLASKRAPHTQILCITGYPRSSTLTVTSPLFASASYATARMMVG